MSGSETGDITPVDEPIALFREWFAEAREREPNDPDAMALATVDSSGLPDVRMVLLKGVDTRGFVFYTNLESAKGEELASNPKAALCLHWKSLERQVRVRGPVVAVSEEEADAYFATRPKDSQIGAWASEQSAPIEGRHVLEARAEEVRSRFPAGELPRPPFWGGFRVTPDMIEFWQGRPGRLHDRLCYRRDGNLWAIQRLSP